jgi:hypothetical protein
MKRNKGTGFTKARFEEGIRYEDILIPIIQDALEEPVSKYTIPNSKYDAFSDNFLIEIKTRNIKSTDYDSYICIASKFKVAKEEPRNVILFYYIIGDNKLFYIQYDKHIFHTFTYGISYCCPSYWIPASCFTQIDLKNTSLESIDV